MERVKQRQIVEALILASPEPIAPARIADLVPRGSRKLVGELVGELNAEYEEQGRAFEIWEVAGGLQVRTRPGFAPYVRQLRRAAALRLSRAALETLAIVAYRQPITRAEIEQVRGVDAGAVLRGLIERRLLRIAGHRDVPGRPLLYATSRRFLEVFSLRTLQDLPTLRDLEELATGSEAAAGPGEGEPEGELEAVGIEGAAVSDEEIEAAAAEHAEDEQAPDEGDEDVLDAAAEAIAAARATAASLRAAESRPERRSREIAGGEAGGGDADRARSEPADADRAERDRAGSGADPAGGASGPRRDGDA